MELKKNPKADLDKQKGLFMQIGLVIALTFVLFAFEWKSYDEDILQLETYASTTFEVENTPITRQEPIKPLPPPPPQTKVSTILNVVKNDVKITEELNINNEVTKNTETDEYSPIGSQEEAPIQESDIFLVVENPPSFSGGEPARAKFIQDHTIYPKTANEKGIQGTVYVSFIVESNGKLSNIKLLRGIGSGCDEEAIRVVTVMPNWNPGKQRGKTVRVQFSMPIRFVLQ